MTVHGEYAFKIKNNIIFSTLIGPFNLEGANAFYAALDVLIHTMTKEYYIVVDLMEFEGAVHEAYAVGDLFTELHITHKSPLKRLIVLKDSLTTTIARSEAKHIFQPETLLFDKMQDAEIWLDENVILDS